MAESKLTETNPMQAWSDFLSQALPPWAMPATLAGTTPAGADPWTDMIGRMWMSNPMSRLLPIDPGQMSRSLGQAWMQAATNPWRVWTDYAEFVTRYTEVMTSTTLRMWGQDAQGGAVVQAEKGDRRFSGPLWQQNLAFDAVKQAYLLVATTMLKSFSDVQGLDEKQQLKVRFYLRQFIDAMSPSNFAMTNPEVLQEALSTGGMSLVRGVQNLMRDMAEGRIRQTDESAFEVGRNLAITPGQVIYRNRLMELIQYTPQTEKVGATPLVFIPNWINRYYVVDLQPENSLVDYLVKNGITVFMISWKNPDGSMEDIGYDDYMELGPLTACRIAREITGAPTVNTTGYCIGGTLQAMTMAYLAAKGEDLINAATFFVTLLDFSDVGETAVFVDSPNIAYVETRMAKDGTLDGVELANMFNLLRANDCIWTFVVNNYLLGKDAPAFDLLYWNADATRMCRKAHSFYLKNTYVENNLIVPGKVTMKDVPIDLGSIKQDIYAVGSELDHLVPWRTSWRITKLTGSNVRWVVGGSGHIAGVINPASRGRGYHWTGPAQAESADAWFERAEKHKGTWWPDWIEWLRERSGRQVAPPKMGGKKYPPIVPAPGEYVREK